jgi:hypothetical protein
MSKEAISGAYGAAEALLRKLAYLASFREQQYQSFCFHWGDDELSPEQEQKLFDDLKLARREVHHQLSEGGESILAILPLVESGFAGLADQLELAYSELGDIEIPGLGSYRFAWPMLRDLAGRVRIWANSYGAAYGAEEADPRFIRDLAGQCPFNHSIDDLIQRRLLLEKSRLLRDFGVQVKEISVENFAERLKDSHRRIQIFKEDTGFDPPENDVDDRHLQKWYAWGVELFGELALKLDLVGLQNLIYGKLSLEKERGAKPQGEKKLNRWRGKEKTYSDQELQNIKQAWDRFRNEYKSDKVLKGIRRGTRIHFIDWAERNDIDIPAIDESEAKKMLDTYRKRFPKSNQRKKKSSR